MAKSKGIPKEAAIVLGVIGLIWDLAQAAKHQRTCPRCAGRDPGPTPSYGSGWPPAVDRAGRRARTATGMLCGGEGGRPRGGRPSIERTRWLWLPAEDGPMVIRQV